MRGGCLAVLGLGLLLLLAGSASGAESAAVSRQTGKRAVVIWGDMRIHMTRDPMSAPVATPRCGDLVRMLGPRWKSQFQFEGDGVVGWASGKGVVVLATPHADARLLVAARNMEAPKHWAQPPNYEAAIALYSRLAALFPRSPYRPLALYRIGQCAEQVAAEASRKKSQEEAAKGQRERFDPTPPGRIELGDIGKWGVTFRWAHLGGHYYYPGDAYRRILREHGNSEWADEAAFALLKLTPTEVGEWEGFPEGALRDLDHWVGFTKRYPHSDVTPQALLEQVYLNRVLYEIYSKPTGQFADRQKASRRRSAAENLCRRISREFPGTEFAAEAEDALADLAEGRNAYLYPDGFDKGG
jgi:hypothetical protein